MAILRKALRANRFYITTLRTRIVILATLFAGFHHDISFSDVPTGAVNEDFLAATAKLYGISEEEALDRLAKEEIAARTEMLVKEMNLASYAGS